MLKMEVPGPSRAQSAAAAVDVCKYRQCEGCQWTYIDFFKCMTQEDDLVSFMYRHGVLPCHVRCATCGAVMQPKERQRKLFFRCRKKNRKTNITCDYTVSCNENSFFSNSRKGKRELVQFVFHYLTRRPPRHAFLREELGLVQTTVTDRSAFVGEVFIAWAVENSRVLGGEGVVVEIDEANIVKRKYSRGQYLEGNRLVAGIEQGSRRFFVVAVKDQKPETLIDVIQTKIHPGTSIHSACWKADERLGEEGCDDLTLNHDVNFVDHEGEDIRKTWVEVRKFNPRFGRAKIEYAAYISECLFLMNHQPFRDRMHDFWIFAGSCVKWPQKLHADEIRVNGYLV